MKFLAIPLSLALCAPVAAIADISFTPYMGAGVESLSTKIDSVKFKNNRVLLHAGAWVAQGIGLEAEISRDISNEEHHSLTLEYDTFLRYGIRLISPPNESKVSLFVLLSSTRANISLYNSNSDQSVKEKLDGYHAAVGLAAQLNPKLQLDLSYNSYNLNKNFDISGIRLSAEYAFGKLTR